MKLISLKCQNCGSEMTVKNDSKEAICEYCGAKFIIDDEMNHIQYDNAEQAGYEFEKGRQRAQYEKSSQSIHNNSSSKKKHTVLWILGWICIFPVPLTILIVKNKKLSLAIKILIIVFAWVIWLLIGASSNEKNIANNSVNNEVTLSDVKNNDVNKSTGCSESIDVFVERYNKNAPVELIYLEDFSVGDKKSEHYRVEFRLSAYKDAIGKSYQLEDTIVDIVSRKDYFGNIIIRLYSHSKTLNDCCDLIEYSSPILDEDIRKENIKNTIDYIKENKEANNYYYSNLGIVLSGDNKQGYDLMIKMKND